MSSEVATYTFGIPSPLLATLSNFYNMDIKELVHIKSAQQDPYGHI